MFQEAFELFDQNKTGGLGVSDVGKVLRSCGQNPTDAELEEIVSQVKTGEEVDVKAVMEAGKLMKAKIAGKDIEAECMEAFKAFDKDGNGTIATACAPTAAHAPGAQFRARSD